MTSIQWVNYEEEYAKGGVLKRKSTKEETGAISKGTSQLRVPLNIGAPKSGGLNI